MTLPKALQFPVGPWSYAVLAPVLLLAQNAVVALAARAAGPDRVEGPYDSGWVYWTLPADLEFWLLPMRAAARLGLTPVAAGFLFALLLAIIVALALFSYQRAALSGGAFFLAALTVVPGLQIPAVLFLALLPIDREAAATSPESGVDSSSVIQGVLAGMILIVLSVIVSALVFGAYGWGLFVLAPFLVGLTTGYIANRRSLLTGGHTIKLVLLAALLGGLALIALALEGLVCILLASPLAAVVAIVGGEIGRAVARSRHGGSTPAMCCALLPAVLAFDAAMPPSIMLNSHDEIEIAAPPAEVWRALTSTDAIEPTPGFVFRLGLAYPVRAQIAGGGEGAVRIGQFSTGLARERITEWRPGRTLAFDVVSQPPPMIELSPYSNVHAPHVSGYFETRNTRFELVPLDNGRTRLIVSTAHELRLDPALYWEPVARWAIRANTARVLEHIRRQAERDGGS